MDYIVCPIGVIRRWLKARRRPQKELLLFYSTESMKLIRNSIIRRWLKARRRRKKYLLLFYSIGSMKLIRNSIIRRWLKARRRPLNSFLLEMISNHLLLDWL